MAALRPLERRLDQRHVVVAADERREPPGTRLVEPRSEAADPFEVEEPDGFANALDRAGAQVLEIEVSVDQPCGVFGEQDMTGLGEGLHPLCQADRVALGGVVHSQVVADLADDDSARVESDPHAEGDAVPSADFCGVRADRVAQMKCCITCTVCMILMRDRSAEERHDPVARVLIDGPFETMNAFGEDLEEALEDAMPFLGVELFRELH